MSRKAANPGKGPKAMTDRAKTKEFKMTGTGPHTSQRHLRSDFVHLLGMIQLNMFDCKQDPVVR